MSKEEKLKYLRPEQYASWCRKVDDPDWTEHRYRTPEHRAMANAIRELRESLGQIATLAAQVKELSKERESENQRMRELLVEMAANMDFSSWPETLKEIESFLTEPAQ